MLRKELDFDIVRGALRDKTKIIDNTQQQQKSMTLIRFSEEKSGQGLRGFIPYKLKSG